MGKRLILSKLYKLLENCFYLFVYCCFHCTENETVKLIISRSEVRNYFPFGYNSKGRRETLMMGWERRMDSDSMNEKIEFVVNHSIHDKLLNNIYRQQQ